MSYKSPARLRQEYQDCPYLYSGQGLEIGLCGVGTGRSLIGSVKTQKPCNNLGLALDSLLSKAKERYLCHAQMGQTECDGSFCSELVMLGREI